MTVLFLHIEFRAHGSHVVHLTDDLVLKEEVPKSFLRAGICSSENYLANA